MNEQLQLKLVEILTGIQGAVRAAGDFALSQLPEIAQTYVAYGRALETVYMVLIIAMVSFLWIFAYRVVVLGKLGSMSIRDYEGAPEFLAAVLCLIGTIALTIAFFSHLSVLLLVWFAPKVWLLKELAALVK